MLMHKLLAVAGGLLAKNKLSILIYHQVFAQTDPMRPSEPDADTFRWQMELISEYFTPLSISAALQHLENETLPKNAVCITFDDGYLNNLQVAAPILNELHIPTTVYIATVFSAGENMWNDRLIDLVAMPEITLLDLSAIGQASAVLSNVPSRITAAQALIKKIKYLPVSERKAIIDQLYVRNQVQEAPRRMMLPGEIKALRALGIEIGAHTVDHPILAVLDDAEQYRQISQSKATLETWLGEPVTGFAYPNGKINHDYNAISRDIVADLKFDYAVSTNWGVTTKNSDKFQLNRFTPWDTSPLKFHLRLLRNLLI